MKQSSLNTYLLLALLTLTGPAKAPVLKTGLAGLGAEAVAGSMTGWNLDRLDQTELPLDGHFVHKGTGAGVRVYVFDTGIDTTHNSMRGRVVPGFDAFPGIKGDNAHGTAVAGLIAGVNDGVAPSALVVSVRVARDEKDPIDMERLALAMEWVIEDMARHPGPAVINWSFVGGGEGLRYPAIERAAARLADLGVLIVEASGNTSVDACLYPTVLMPETFVVGATELKVRSGFLGRKGKSWDEVAQFSDFGKCVDMYAPGFLNKVPMSGTLDGEMLVSGTSYAAPLVTGAAALLLAEAPDLSVVLLRARLSNNALRGVVRGADKNSLLLNVTNR